MTTLIKTLNTEKGQLYSITNGDRFLFADCDVEIRVYEKETKIPTLGKGASVKKLYISLLICEDIDVKQEITPELLKRISRFEITADLLRKDGIYERIIFDNISLNVIDVDGKWEFELNDIEKIKKFI